MHEVRLVVEKWHGALFRWGYGMQMKAVKIPYLQGLRRTVWYYASTMHGMP